jgi:hypothetical protein
VKVLAVAPYRPISAEKLHGRVVAVGSRQQSVNKPDTERQAVIVQPLAAFVSIAIRSIRRNHTDNPGAAI